MILDGVRSVRRTMSLFTPRPKERNLMSDILQVETQGRVLRLVLNRPEKRNALNANLCRELADAVNRADRDPKIGAIVLAANGTSFSAGMDVHELGSADFGALSDVHGQLFTMGSRLGKPLVTAVDGPALGGGFGLAANGHILVASEKAQFGLTEIRLGLWPFLVYRAVEIAIGERRAVELSLTGRVFDAREAQAMGLAHVIHENPNAKAMEIGEHLASYSPMAIRSGLNYVQEARGKDWQIAGRIARRVREEVFQSADFQEGIRAFREKRQPVWPSVAYTNQYPGDETP
jgi:enoyl-CoA hydratase/carnithine racemase